MTFLSEILLLAGAAIGVYAGMLLLVRAFKTSLVWGLVSTLVPLGNIIFMFVHWSKGRRPFIAHIIALVLLTGGCIASPGVIKSLPPAMQVALGRHQDPVPHPEDFSAEITSTQDHGDQLQQQIASQVNNLTSQYNDLAKRRALLKAGDTLATAAFNRDAASYTARKKQLDTLRAESVANDGQLTALLQKQADFETKTYAAAHSVTVYGTLTCPACRMAREYLTSKGVAFRDVDVEHDPQGAAEFQQRGGGGVPMVVINGAQMTGFSSAWVDDHL